MLASLTLFTSLLNNLKVLLELKKGLDDAKADELANALFSTHIALKKCWGLGNEILDEFEKVLTYVNDKKLQNSWTPATDEMLHIQVRHIKNMMAEQASVLSLAYELENILEDHIDLLSPNHRDRIGKMFAGKGTMIWNIRHNLLTGIYVTFEPSDYTQDSIDSRERLLRVQSSTIFHPEQMKKDYDNYAELVEYSGRYFEEQNPRQQLDELKTEIDELGAIISDNFTISKLRKIGLEDIKYASW